MDPHRTAAVSAVSPAAASPHATSPKPNPTTPFSDSDNSSKPHPKMVGPKSRTVQKVSPTEKFERMIDCITADETEIKQHEHDYLTRRLSVSLLSSSRSGRRRRSICGSEIQLADVFANNGVKVVSADMPPFMQIHAVDCARKAYDSMEKFTSKSLALSLKKEFDGVYGPAWHCIVGKSFGSFVTHSVGGFLYFSMTQKLYILLFKTTVQKAN